MAAKFFTGLPLDGPDPECVFGHGEAALASLAAGRGPAPGARPLQGRTRDGTLPIPVPAPVRFRAARRVADPAPSGARPDPRVELGRATWLPGRGDVGQRAPRRPAGLARAARPPPPPRHRHPDRRGAGRRLAGQRPGVVVAPAVAYGASGEHAGFAGTLVGRSRVLADAAGRAGPVAPAAPSPGSCWCPPTAGTPRRWPRPSAQCGAEGDPVLVWQARRAGRRRPCRADRDVADVRPRPGGGAARPAPCRAAPSRSRGCCPGCAPRGCGRCRPTACWATRPGRAPPRDAPLRALVRDLAAVDRRAGRRRDRRRPVAPPMSPVAVVTGAARGIGAATVDPLVAGGLAGGGGRRLRRRPRARLPAGHRRPTSGRRRPGTAARCAAVVGDVRVQADMDAAVARPSPGSAASTPPSPSPG